MKILGIGGVPASGKSTFVRNLMAHYKPGPAGTYKKLLQYSTWQYKPGCVLFIFGVYKPNELFPGTDRLSMAVQPIAEDFVKIMSFDKNARVVFEGDRLFTESFIRYCNGIYPKEHARFWILSASTASLQARHLERKDQQNERWLGSRETKIRNLTNKEELGIELFSNETLEEQNQLLKEAHQWITN